MKYQNVISASFTDRPNRFVAHVDLNGRTETVHVKNTGRCRELLVPGATVWLEDFEGRMGSRKMRYSLIAADKITKDGCMTVNVDSQAPNKVVLEGLREGKIRLEGLDELRIIRPETKFGDSRFDFYLEDGGRALENPGQRLGIVVLQLQLDAETRTQWRGEQSRAGGGTHQRERVERNLHTAGIRPRVDHNVDFVIFHSRV